MLKRLTILNRELEYTEKASKTRSIRLSVKVDGKVTLLLPWFVSSKRGEKFLKEKASWIFQKLDHFNSFDRTLLPKNTRANYLKYKDEAKKIIEIKIKEFNEFYKFTFDKVTIRNQKTRWGSCSKNGNLNFNYKVALLPEKFTNYVVVHELCHLKEFNHSKKFWDLVGKTIPDHKELRAELKKIWSH